MTEVAGNVPFTTSPESDGVFTVGQTVPLFGGGTTEFLGIANVGGVAYPVFDVSGNTGQYRDVSAVGCRYNRPRQAVDRIYRGQLQPGWLDKRASYPAVHPGHVFSLVQGFTLLPEGEIPEQQFTAEDGTFDPGDFVTISDRPGAGCDLFSGRHGHYHALRSGPGRTSEDGRAGSDRRGWVDQGEMDRTPNPSDPVRPRAPVQIQKGTLGDDLPHRDLRLTADRAFFLDRMLIQAGALVNHGTIYWIEPKDLGETYVVYHIETEAHAIILAEGDHAETFIDNVSRRNFDNHAEYEALYGNELEMQELSYPRAMLARQVPVTVAQRVAPRNSGLVIPFTLGN